jgi:hypothetical protein
MAISPFRSFGSTNRAAALAVAGAIGAFAFAAPAAAQQRSSVCDKIADHAKAIQCEIKQLDIRTEQSRLRQLELDNSTICIEWLTKGVKDGALVKSEILQKVDGDLSKNACRVAKEYGFGRKAELTR